ncbi:hypothetical protein EDD86DRAFT_185781 [Gorgonomyces haynaldii]|nr:hypothetical protein EDD86DRAFT_185781 [Gorgonomyces haynaldii]
MNISQPVSTEIEQVRFSFYKPDQIRSLSVLHVTSPEIFDNLGHPKPRGLYDPALGPLEKHGKCQTCHLQYAHCPGHFGHIELSMPVYNPLTFRLMYKLLQSTCYYCHHLRLSKQVVHYYSMKLLLLRRGLLAQASELDTITLKKMPKKDDEKEDELEQFTKEEDYINQLDQFVKHAIETCDPSPKTVLLSDAIKKLERQFLAAIPSQACQNCRGVSPKFRLDGMKIFEKNIPKKTKSLMHARGLRLQSLFGEEPRDEEDETKDHFLMSFIVRKHLELLWDNEHQIMDLLYGAPEQSTRKSSADMFFMDCIAVTPSRFRPVSKMGDMQFEHPQNIHLVEIIKANNAIKDLQDQERETLSLMDAGSKDYLDRKEAFLKRTVDALIKLQTGVHYLIDSSKAPLGPGGKAAPPGVKQILEKKEGLFRKHMMGKRVNYAARSVISPDPYIETNEIGIPPVFAKKLTYPEPVTHHNVKELRDAVINGPDQWPGATHIQNENGVLISLASFDVAGRTALANQLLTPSLANNHESFSHQFKNVNKKVYRHLKNGDFLLLNRQPTLHKPSIMAHTARILPGEKTIRMHYANCNTYNADFDGDEMNAHFPQNEVARAEAMLIARNDLQYLVPTDGGVLRGLIQDHVDAGVHMCSKDTFFTREEYQQLVYMALRESNIFSSAGNGNIEDQIHIGRNGRIVTFQPTIFKPVPRWTGKQVISTVLYNLTPADSNLLNLKSKSRIPAKQWGPTAPEEQTVLFMDGDLIHGILDKSQFGASANGLVHAVYEVYGPRYAGALLSMLGRLFTGYLQLAGFSCRLDDLLLNKQGDAIRKDLIQKSRGIGIEAAEEFTKAKPETPHMRLELEKVLRDSEKMAGLDSAMKSRTNRVTSEIISACIPNQLYKPFPKNNMQVMTVSGAKGSGVNVSQISCLLGQQELEGKRVPTMVSGKTLPSFKAFDTSARSGGYITGRFLTGIKPQEYFFHCMAGREGLIDTAVKTSRSGYLQRCLIKHLEGLKVHYDHSVRDVDGSIIQFQYGEDGLDILKQTTLQKFEFNALNFQSLVKRYDPSSLADKLDEESVSRYLKRHKKKGTTPDPILSVFTPSRYMGAVSEKFRDELNQFTAKNASKLLLPRKTKEEEAGRPGWSGPMIPERSFQALMHLKYMKALVEPGEAVGLLAAQSIGEPSTQMTLNTFHFAGFGAKNVTLGIPRLREIIMTASATLKTPLMRLPVKEGVPDKVVQKTCEKIGKLVLSEIMEGVKISEKLTPRAGETQTRSKVIKVTLQFWDTKAYGLQYSLTKERLADVLEQKFIPAIERAIVRDLKGRIRKEQEEEDEIGHSDEEDALSDAGDGDATDAKLQRNKSQHVSYDEPDEEEVEMMQALDEEEEVEQTKEETERADRIVEQSKYVSHFSFNGKECTFTVKFAAETKKILMLALTEQVCQQTVINQIQNISRCYPLPSESENDKSVNLGTDGCNLTAMWEFDNVIDVNRIYTNDIAAVLRTFGVEAARQAITQEIASVFGVYGINVDTRHLSLIADYMTFEGGYKPFNRIGMNSNPSPFAQMSYETTGAFLTAATLLGDFDPLDSPSARLVMGQPVKAGTGAFDVFQPTTIRT